MYILTYVRVALATSDVQRILEIPATDEIHLEDRNQTCVSTATFESCGTTTTNGRINLYTSSLRNIRSIRDTSVDTLTDTSRSTYRPTLDRYVDRHIGRHSADMSTDASVECQSICRPIHRSRSAQNTHDPLRLWIEESPTSHMYERQPSWVRHCRPLGNVPQKTKLVSRKRFVRN